jgi:hypothetical protein
MSYFVYITFDLKGADEPDYRQIQSKLKKIDFSKFIIGKRKVQLKLPSNMFVAKFDDNDFDKSKQLLAHVKKQLLQIFKSVGVKGSYFISAGKNWAWKKGAF